MAFIGPIKTLDTSSSATCFHSDRQCLCPLSSQLGIWDKTADIHLASIDLVTKCTSLHRNGGMSPGPGRALVLAVAALARAWCLGRKVPASLRSSPSGKFTKRFPCLSKSRSPISLAKVWRNLWVGKGPLGFEHSAGNWEQVGRATQPHAAYPSPMGDDAPPSKGALGSLNPDVVGDEIKHILLRTHLRVTEHKTCCFD